MNINEKNVSSVSPIINKFELICQGYDIFKTVRKNNNAKQNRHVYILPWSVDCYTAMEGVLADSSLILKMCLSFNVLVPHLVSYPKNIIIQICKRCY